jgi:hypothetical protein
MAAEAAEVIMATLTLALLLQAAEAAVGQHGGQAHLQNQVILPTAFPEEQQVAIM